MPADRRDGAAARDPAPSERCYDFRQAAVLQGRRARAEGGTAMSGRGPVVRRLIPLLLAVAGGILGPPAALASDHNDPNAVNSIFSDVDVSAADLYDIFGFPSNDRAGGEKVVVALTFASVPSAGVFDTDMLYRIRFAPNPRVSASLQGDNS